jgi:hypothetical protein
MSERYYLPHTCPLDQKRFVEAIVHTMYVILT